MPLPSELREGRAGGCLSKDAGSDSPSPRLPHNGASIVIQRLELSCARRGNGMDAGGLPPQVGANVESWGVQVAQNSLPPSLRGGSPLQRKAMASKSQNHPRIIPVISPPHHFGKVSLSPWTEVPHHVTQRAHSGIAAQVDPPVLPLTS